MKTITILLFTIMLNACGASSDASKADTLPETQEKMTQNENISLEYSAVTRGSYKSITITNKVVSWVNERNAKAQTLKLDDKQWRQVVELTNAIDLVAIPELEAPTKAHEYDGAAIGTLIVSKNGVTYQSQAFDAGNPNTVLADLIEKMIALTNRKK
ncbi:MAG: hypothetical protein KBT58_12365 [Bizionia sp.]|nr:hypothetical protein [Bizionia sp.]